LVLVSKLKLIEVEFLSTGVVYRSDRDFLPFQLLLFYSHSKKKSDPTK